MQILCQNMFESLGGRDEGRVVTFNAFIILANKIFRCPYLETDFYIFAFCPSCCCDDQNSWWRPHQTTLTVQNTQFVDTNFVQIRQKTNFTYSQNSQNHLFWLNNRNNQAYEIIARVLHWHHNLGIFERCLSWSHLLSKWQWLINHHSPTGWLNQQYSKQNSGSKKLNTFNPIWRPLTNFHLLEKSKD